METLNVGRTENGRYLCILTEAAADARPTWFSCQVYLRMQRYADTYGQILLAHNISELPDQFGIADSPKPQCFTPLRKLESRHGKDVLAKMVAWV